MIDPHRYYRAHEKAYTALRTLTCGRSTLLRRMAKIDPADVLTLGGDYLPEQGKARTLYDRFYRRAHRLTNGEPFVFFDCRRTRHFQQRRGATEIARLLFDFAMAVVAGPLESEER